MTTEQYSKELFLAVFYEENKGSERLRNTQKVKEEVCNRGRICLYLPRPRTKFP